MSRRRASRRLLLGCLTVPLGTLAQAVPAQLLQDPRTVVVPPEAPITTAQSVFERDNAVGVADRMFPAFSAQGVKVGNFDLFPGLAVGTFATSNVLADNNRRRGDLAVVVRPEATLRTSQGPYRVSAFVRADLRRYARTHSENTEEALAGVQGAVAIGALSNLNAGVTYGTLIQPRFAADSPVNAAKPLEYNALSGFVGGTIEGASSRIIVRADLSQLRFRDTPNRLGGTIQTQDRNRMRVQALVRAERAISSFVSLYAAGTVNKIDYQNRLANGQQRDSTGFGAYLGSNFDLTDLLHGDVRVGYLRQKFDTAGVRAISGLGLLGTVTYFPNRLLTVTAHGESTVQDSGVPGTTGVLHSGGWLRGDAELRRYIVASLEGGYYHDTYRGQDRRDRLPYVDASATYLSRGHWNARLGYRYLARHSRTPTGTGTATRNVQSFDDHRLSTTLTFQY